MKTYDAITKEASYAEIMSKAEELGVIASIENGRITFIGGCAETSVDVNSPLVLIVKAIVDAATSCLE